MRKVCTLWPQRNLHKSMVNSTSTISTKNSRTYNLKQYLTCTDYGIYVATCKIYANHYVVQTINKFSKRWCTHRNQWKSNKQLNNDKAVLRIHYLKHHKETLDSNPDLADCYFVTLVDKPNNIENLDIYKSSWINKLNAKININKTILSIFE